MNSVLVFLWGSRAWLAVQKGPQVESCGAVSRHFIFVFTGRPPGTERHTGLAAWLIGPGCAPRREAQLAPSMENRSNYRTDTALAKLLQGSDLLHPIPQLAVVSGRPGVCVADYISLLRPRRSSRCSLVLQTWKVLRNRLILIISKSVTVAEAELLLTSRKLLLTTTSLIWILPPLLRDGVVMIAVSLP